MSIKVGDKVVCCCVVPEKWTGTTIRVSGDTITVFMDDKSIFAKHPMWAGDRTAGTMYWSSRYVELDVASKSKTS